VFLGGAPIGSPLAGWAAQQFGPRISLIAGGLISVAAVCVIGVLLAHHHGIRARDCLRPSMLLRAA
jgi:MFS family permease